MPAAPEDRAGIDHIDRMSPEQEARDHAKVPAAATQRPEQIGVALLAGGRDRAVRQHHVGLEQVVDGETAFAREIAGTTAQRSEEHTSELQSLMRISYAVFCLKKKKILREQKRIT